MEGICFLALIGTHLVRIVVTLRKDNGREPTDILGVRTCASFCRVIKQSSRSVRIYQTARSIHQEYTTIFLLDFLSLSWIAPGEKKPS